MRTHQSFTLADKPGFKLRLLNWAGGYKEAVWLDSNNHPDPYGSLEVLLAVDAETSLVASHSAGFRALREYHKKTSDWLVGYIGYDMKNDLESLTSDNTDGLKFPDLCFFQPRKVIRITSDRVDFMYLKKVAGEIQSDFQRITELDPAKEKGLNTGRGEQARLRMRMPRQAYYSRVRHILEHIHRGNIYEANFCQEFFLENTVLDPWKTYNRLNHISQTPFAAFFRLDHFYLLCASPERFLKKKEDLLISQPIKGTAKRSRFKNMDARYRTSLLRSTKERAENIMIVDLVRNDLSKSAVRGSVQVTELCQVRTYRQVHQLVSTVIARIRRDMNPIQLLMEAFPMGSMTGAPKFAALKIIEEYEMTKRGAYSGALGYITPENDFDFNVVIRSILYNEASKYVSFSVGSAITARSEPEKEYEECLVKARAMREVLESNYLE